ncbi:MAG: ribosome small subunit-dependent GTPase A [Pseudomonadales bacterium]
MTTEQMAAAPALENELSLLGWSSFFRQQLTLEEVETGVPARVFEVHRSGLVLRYAGGETDVPLGGRWFQGGAEERPTVGDWLLLEADRRTILRLLDRSSLIKRMSVSKPGEVQLIAANVDTLLLVTSCNADFNPSRLERYLALAHEARVQPVVVLTKADLSSDTDSYQDAARLLGSDLVVEVVNALAPETLAPLRSWCRPGQTVALLGSSGVGKSTLINSLAGVRLQDTGEVREADAKGRHTTTHRSLHLLPGAGMLLDSPGMRELGITDVQAGLASTFEDVASLASACRFANCAHLSEPGCAIRAAIEEGRLDARRLDSYRKLRREELYNSETVAERHARVRQWSKKVKQAQRKPDH